MITSLGKVMMTNMRPIKCWEPKRITVTRDTMKSSSPIGSCILNTKSRLTKFLTKLKRSAAFCNFPEKDRENDER